MHVSELMPEPVDQPAVEPAIEPDRIVFAAVYEPGTGAVKRIVHTALATLPLCLAADETWAEVPTGDPDVVIDTDTRQVLQRTPQPDAWHAWDHAARVWRDRLEPAQRLALASDARRTEIEGAIAALEAKQPRALRELALANGTDETDVRAAAWRKLAELDAQIATLRAELVTL
jgi:hypothetical protein